MSVFFYLTNLTYRLLNIHDNSNTDYYVIQYALHISQTVTKGCYKYCAAIDFYKPQALSKESIFDSNTWTVEFKD